MKKYMVYIDDIKCVFKQAILAESENEVREQLHGCGEIVAIKEVGDDYLISLEKVEEALVRANFGKAEITYITEALYKCRIAE